MVVRLLERAHAAARAGRTAEVRACLADLAEAAEHSEDVCIAVGMLHFLTGDARSSVAFLERVTNHTEASRLTLTMAYAAIGKRERAAVVAADIGRLKIVEEVCAEDVIDQRDIEGLQAPLRDDRDWIIRGDFEAAGRQIAAHMERLPASAPGAQDLRLRSGRRLPRWNGESTGCLLVIMNTMGYGDAFLLGRYLRHIRNAADTVKVLLQHPIIPLAARTLEGFELLGESQAAAALNSADCYTNAWLFPWETGARYGDARWLEADPVLVERWRPAPGFNVGIVWRGSEKSPGNALRSIAPDELQPLFQVPGVTWHSLQVGPGATHCPQACIDYSARLKDFHDTAALISSLDLVIAVDTGVASLTGALGAPLWVLAEEEPEYRWCGEGECTPWFPSARVFRQDGRGWAPVVERVAAELTRDRMMIAPVGEL